MLVNVESASVAVFLVTTVNVAVGPGTIPVVRASTVNASSATYASGTYA